MTIRVGVEGRVLVGPKGGPGNVTVPLRIAWCRKARSRERSDQILFVTGDHPAGCDQAAFTQVEDDLTFPLPPDKNDSRYVSMSASIPRVPCPARRSRRRRRSKPRRSPRPRLRPAARRRVSAAAAAIRAAARTFAPPPPPPPAR